jgi:hypothetical protein
MNEDGRINNPIGVSNSLNNSGSVLMKYSFERNKMTRMQGLQTEIEGLNREAEDIQSRMEDLDYRLQGARDENEANQIIGEVQNLQSQMSKLQNRISHKSKDLTSLARKAINMNEVQSLLGIRGEKGVKGFSNSIVNTVSIISWISKGGVGDNILTGEWEKIGIMDSKGLARQFSVIVEEDNELRELGYAGVQTSANTVMGQLAGHLYYLHPINFMKGMISGDIWLKLGKKGIKKYGNKSIFAFLHSVSPRQWLKNNKLFQGVKSGFQKILPSSLAVKTFLRNIITKVIAINPFTGVLVNFLVNALGDEVMVFLTTTLIAALFGVVAVFTGGLGLLPSTQEVAGIDSEYMKSCNSHIMTIVDQNPFPNKETLCYHLSVDLGTQFLEDMDYTSLNSNEATKIREQVSLYEHGTFE